LPVSRTAIRNKLTLIDTSVWIEQATNPQHPLRPVVSNLLARRMACTTGPVLAELYQGTRSDQDLQAISSLLKTTQILQSSLETWIQAGSLAARLRKKGLTIALIDCLVAATAVEHHVALLTYDRHFRLIAKHFPLELEAASLT